MTAEIYVQTTEVSGENKRHLAIWIVENGVTTIVDARASGFLGNTGLDPLVPLGEIVLEKNTLTGTPSQSEIESFNLNKLTFSTQQEAEEAADTLLEYFDNSGTSFIDNGREFVRTGVGYGLLGPNSNSIGNTLLSAIGVDLRSLNLYEDGNSSLRNYSPENHPGHYSLVDTSGSDELSVFSYDDSSSPTIFVDSGGTDIINIEYGGKLKIVTNGTASGTNTIVIEGYSSASDIGMKQWGSNLSIYDKSTGEDIVEIVDHFLDLNTTDVLVKNSSGTLVASADLTDLASSDLETFIGSIPSWYSSTVTWFGVTLTGWWDPLVIDIDGNGVSADYIAPTTNGFNNFYATYFDLDGDGFAQATSWHGDGFLVRDLNANGRIDNGTEMFGDATTDGFTALAAFDGNADGVIDSNDVIWSDLQIWHDANADGQTQSDELLTLASLDITGIILSAIANSGGNVLTHSGTVTTSTGTLEAGNYNFQIEAANTRYAQDYDFDIRAAFLPTLRGYNQMPDLHIALSLDNDETDPGSLMAMMTELASYSFTEIFENWADVTETIENILFRWAGVEDVSPTSRGSFISDARIVEFMEQYLGERFVDRNVEGNEPGAVQAQGIEELWHDTMLPRMIANLLFQGTGSELFVAGQSFDLMGDQIAGTKTLSQVSVDTLETAAAALSSTSERVDFWVSVASYFHGVAVSNFSVSHLNLGLSSSEIAMMTDAVESSDPTLTWSLADHDPANGVISIAYRLQNPQGEQLSGDANANDIDGTAFDDVVSGGAGADDLYGDAGQDTIYGHNEDGTADDNASDLLDGGAGDDALYGGGGDDTLSGGTGNDQLFGEDGDDDLYDGIPSGSNEQNILNGGAGDDDYYILGTGGGSVSYIQDSSGFDEIFLPSFYQINLESALFRRLGNDDLYIEARKSVGGIAATIIIENQFTDLTSSVGVGVERIRFTDGGQYTSWDVWIDLKQYLLNYTGVIETRGTDVADIIYGLENAQSDDFIRARAGDDVVYGGDGDDTIFGDEGNDIIYGGDGNDILNAFDSSESNMQEFIDGGDGNDFLYGSGELYGGNGDDYISAYDGLNRLDGGGGNDTIVSINASGANIIFASAGNDTLEASNLKTHQDSLEFATGVTLQDLTLTRKVGALDDLIVTHSGGTVTIKGQLYRPSYYYTGAYSEAVEFFAFSSGQVSASALLVATHGTATDDSISGIRWGASQDDVIYGYDGNDTINSSSGNDFIDGGAGNDDINGGNDDDMIIGGAGDDEIDGGNGIDLADYSTATSGVIVNLASDQASNDGDGGSDTLISIENITGSAFADSITGDAGTNVLSGGAGNDTLVGGAGNDTLDGGDGVDTVDYSAAVSGINLNLNTSLTYDDGAGNGDQDTLISVEKAIGSAFADVIYGASGVSNELWGEDGDDELRSTGGGDILHGGSGEDYLWGGSGADTLYGDEDDDTIYGNDGNDLLHGGDGVDWMHGNNGDDEVHGGAGNDTVMGDAGNDVLYGDDGDDQLLGHEGNDTLYGGAGADDLRGYNGDDIMYGGDGDDLFYDISALTGQGNDTYYGEGGNDTIYAYSGTNMISGGDGNDVMYGGSDTDTISGDAGDDNIRGGDGNDILYGGESTNYDYLYGDAGDDILYGGSGHDRLTGGTGADTFVFEATTAANGSDTIYDFSTTDGDVLDLSAMLSVYDPLNDLLTDFVQITDNGTHSYLKVDVDGAANGTSFVQVAYMPNVTGLTDETALVSSGNLIAA